MLTSWAEKRFTYLLNWILYAYGTSDDRTLCFSAVTIVMSTPGSLLFASEVSEILQLTTSTTLLSIISFIGIGANIINVIIYFRNGFQESASVTFFTLSISDLCISISCFVISVFIWVSHLSDGLSIDPFSFIEAIPVPILGVYYVISTSAATYLSVERCMCVVFPLKVKSIFNKKTTFAAMCIITLWGITCFIPYLSTQELKWSFDPQYNTTRLIRQMTETRVHVRYFINTVVLGIQPITAQIVISVCTVTLIVKLKKLSTKFGNKTTQPNVNMGKVKKERTLIKMVISVAAIFIMCNLPCCIVSVVRFINPSFDVGGDDQEMYYLLLEILFCFVSLNASVNTVAYYKCNSVYRQMFKSMFKC